MLNGGFGALAKNPIDLYPAERRTEIDAFNDRIYPDLNNGVYRAGFATTQVAYEEAFADVFSCLDWVEQQFEDRSFLFADHPTESDIRLFVTLVRFDVAYHGIFKCNLRRLSDYAKLRAFCRRMIETSGWACAPRTTCRPSSSNSFRTESTSLRRSASGQNRAARSA